ncbi:MAG: bifunctional phosphopantothenoylcysteine decarboxylase/phosphopantothenate--cysteine ligase CoaBC [Gammaproteobacteria bacterium]|nr:bifunctional phosphopantothenoylcysteine decarboxylase/phosphopantothenate--cysteine ligase CoaBC [Gammaproteobacteria bacterium]MBL7000063.1 bifunctional phosphopantothenoylcysteine decarboxylase/phosphopantothenate--cysteine ligase CoaBC [Gammaproteobacteria bacterium]
MTDLHNKKILLGISGGIAAYKAAEFSRLLIKQGATVRVVMTAAAQEFIRPLTFQALTGNRVYSELFEADAQNAMDHIDLARWADLLVIAPASANTIAKLADGYADNLLLTIALATQSRIALAPAMNQQMYQNPASADNLARLRDRGIQLWGPDEGLQACGETGPGRMLEPAVLLSHVQRLFQPGRLTGCRIMITAGPTREAIDPVRYISNRSSGKMGYALAQAALDAGAAVTLVTGPVCLQPPAGLRVLKCQSAEEMYQQVMSTIGEQDIFIASAAVADYRVDTIASEKIKKSAPQMQLTLTKNKDILAAVAALERKPFCVGFAAETSDLEQYALSKLEKKKLDMVAANRVDDPQSGFDVDINALTVFWTDGSQQLPRQSKTQLAIALLELIAQRYQRIHQP